MSALLRVAALLAALALALSIAQAIESPGTAAAASDTHIGFTPATPSIQMYDDDDDHMWGDGDGWGWVWMAFMMPMMLIFWGGLILLVVWLVRRWPERGAPHDVDAIEIARRRYARGEINREELEQIRRDLTA